MRPDDRRRSAVVFDHLCFWRPGRWKAFVSRLALSFGPKRLTRDVRRLQAMLIADGRAAWLGDPPPTGAFGESEDALVRARDRVLDLF